MMARSAGVHRGSAVTDMSHLIGEDFAVEPLDSFGDFGFAGE
jgi:hypothetical protein